MKQAQRLFRPDYKKFFSSLSSALDVISRADFMISGPAKQKAQEICTGGLGGERREEERSGAERSGAAGPRRDSAPTPPGSPGDSAGLAHGGPGTPPPATAAPRTRDVRPLHPDRPLDAVWSENERDGDREREIDTEIERQTGGR